MCSIIVLVKIDLSNIESGRIIAIGIAFSYRGTNNVGISDSKA
jgi:hypothetical protein